MCEFEGNHKVVNADGHCTNLYCRAHCDAWMKRLGGRVVTPRRMDGDGPIQCQADWPLPAVVPG